MRSPTTSYWSDEKGVIRPEIVDLYENLAKGGIGLIVKGHTYITVSGKGHKGQAGIGGDIHVPNLMKITILQGLFISSQEEPILTLP